MFRKITNSISNLAPYIFTRTNAPRIFLSQIVSGTSILMNYETQEIFVNVIAMLASASSAEFLGVEMNPSDMLGIYIAANTISSLLPSLRTRILSPLSYVAAQTGLNDYMSYYFGQSYEYHKVTSKGKHQQLMSQCMYVIPQISSQIFETIVPTCGEIIFAGSVLGTSYGATLGLSMTGTLSAYVIYSAMTAPNICKMRSESINASIKSWQDIDNFMHNYEAVSIFNNASYARQTLNHSFNEMSKKHIQSSNNINNITMGQLLLGSTAYGIVSLLAGMGAEKQTYSTNDFIFITTYISMFSSRLTSLGSTLNHLVAALMDIDAYFQEIKKKSSIMEYSQNALQITSDTAAIEFENISMDYENKLALNNVSFKIQPGMKVGIVGESGSGKSTLRNLLFRFYDPKEGRILINGQDIKRDVSIESLRMAISIVPQDTFLFNATIFENIAFGGRNRSEPITREKVLEAATLVGLDSLIHTLPDGLDTLIGENGSKLSGGQRQRIAIARAFMKKPCIYIFDEATSALDPKAYLEVQTGIDKVSKDQGITSVHISHVLKTYTNCDTILVLNPEGQLAEQGTHEELLRNNGIYADLWSKQNQSLSDAAVARQVDPAEEEEKLLSMPNFHDESRTSQKEEKEIMIVTQENQIQNTAMNKSAFGLFQPKPKAKEVNQPSLMNRCVLM
jgi:ABC-type multidrug transport system fused ATPase/permease subunit